jgi:tRNA nucleotidyltransferase (CCA-adding enzyme)
MQLPKAVLDLAQACDAGGGCAWVVGGRVRESLMGLGSKDIDIEVHGLEADELLPILSGLGPVNEIGKSFGVFKLVVDEVEMDVSIPRRDSQAGPRHKDVQVVGDPHMGIEEAARRRDLTINAIAYDPLTGEYADPYGGVQDIERGRLTAVDTMTFLDDPLRALRVVQFAARFGFSVHDELTDLCHQAQIATLPAERIWTEIEKLLMKSPAPSIGWTLARRTGLLRQVLPEVADVPPSAIDQALDRAAEMREDLEDPGRATSLMVAAMLHTLPPQRTVDVLDRLKLFALHGYPVRKRVIECVTHWRYLAEPRSDSDLRHLSDKAEILVVGTTAWAVSGRSAALGNIDRADRLGIAEAPLDALVKGQDLVELGMAQGPQIGALLAEVRQAQNEGLINDRSQALAWLRERKSEGS